MEYASLIHKAGPDTLVVEDGGVIAVASNTGLTIDGVAVTAGEAPATYLADVTPGTLAASKALVVDSNKKINELDITAAKLNGTAVTATAAAINNLVQGTAANKKINAGSYTVVADDDTAGTKTIAVGLTVVAAIVQVLRSGKAATSDIAVSWSTTNLVVADGSTYTLTAGDVVNYIVFGT